QAPRLEAALFDESQFPIQRLRAMIRIDHFEDVALRGQRLDRSLHQLPSDAAPPMRDHHASAAVVRLIAVKAIENEADEPLAVERSDREIRPISAAHDEVRQI